MFNILSRASCHRLMDRVLPSENLLVFESVEKHAMRGWFFMLYSNRRTITFLKNRPLRASLF